MKKLGQIRENYNLITEKEEAESRKLTTLVRAGLFDAKKLPMLKRALSKDAKDMTPAERKILIELLDSLMAEMLQSQQVYSKVKQNVMMKEDFEYEMARTELKTLIHDAQKILTMLKGEGNLEAWVQSKITKAADYINAAADNITHSDETVSEAKTFDGYLSKYDPRYTKMPTDREIPTVVILKRKAIRIYPDNQKVALYYSQALDKYVTIPFGAMQDSTMNEEIKQDEDDPYIVKSTYTKYRDPKDAKNIAKMHSSIENMKRNLASGRYKSKKSLEDTIKGHSETLEKMKKKAPKNTETKKLDLSKANATQLSKSNFKRLRKAVFQDKEMHIGGKLGTYAGLAAARGVGKLKKAIVNKVNKVNTTSEESIVKSKFYAKREQQKLDEVAPVVLGGMALGAAARAAIPHVGRFVAGQAAKQGAKQAAKQAARTPVGKAPKPGTPSTPKPQTKPAPKPAETVPTPKTQPKPDAKPQAKTEPAPTPTPAPKSQGFRGRLARYGRRASAVAGGVGAAAAAALSAIKDIQVDKQPSQQKPFTLQAKTSKAMGNVRTGVDARDTTIYRKAMQQNESVLQQLYNVNENEEKSINIANESVVINNTVAKKIIGVYESVNKQNKEKIESMLNESIDSFKKIASFAARQ